MNKQQVKLSVSYIDASFMYVEINDHACPVQATDLVVLW